MKKLYTQDVDMHSRVIRLEVREDYVPMSDKQKVYHKWKKAVWDRNDNYFKKDKLFISNNKGKLT